MEPGLSTAPILVAASSADITDTAESALVALGASKRYFIFSVHVTNTDATVATQVDLLDGTSGTVLHSFVVAAVTGRDEAVFPEGLPLTKGKAIVFICRTNSAQVRVGITYKALAD